MVNKRRPITCGCCKDPPDGGRIMIGEEAGRQKRRINRLVEVYWLVLSVYLKEKMQRVFLKKNKKRDSKLKLRRALFILGSSGYVASTSNVP